MLIINQQKSHLKLRLFNCAFKLSNFVTSSYLPEETVSGDDGLVVTEEDEKTSQGKKFQANLRAAAGKKFKELASRC